jgi:hypothetical protein
VSIAALVIDGVFLVVGSVFLAIIFGRPCQSRKVRESSESSDGHDNIRIEDLGGRDKAFVLSPSQKDVFYQEEQPSATTKGPDGDPFKAVELK